MIPEFPRQPTPLYQEWLAFSQLSLSLAGMPAHEAASKIAATLHQSLQADGVIVRFPCDTIATVGTISETQAEMINEASAHIRSFQVPALPPVLPPHEGSITIALPSGAAFSEEQQSFLLFVANQAAFVASQLHSKCVQETELERILKDAQLRQEMLLGAGEVGTWEYDVVNDVITSDRNLAGMFGVPHELSISGAPLSAYLAAVHPDDVDGLHQSIQESIAYKDRVECEYRILSKNGKIRWVVARGIIARDDDGKAIKLPGIVVDITAQRDAESELRATLHRWHLALDATELGTWNIDPHTGNAVGDDRLRVIFMEKNERLSFQKALEMIHPDDIERVKTAISAATNPKDPALYSEEFRIIRPNGKIIWVLSKGRASFEKCGDEKHLVSFDGITMDITERRLAEAERKRASEDLQLLAEKLSEADRKKDEFLATLAHELRNPLAPIRTGLEVMKMAASDPAMVEKVRSMMEGQVIQMVRLIDDLMDLSRITNGKIELRKDTFDLIPAIYQAADTVQDALTQANLTLEILAPETPLLIYADSARFSQIITNLLTNAARYSDKGGNVRVTIEEDHENAVIRVQDTGIGIAPDMLESIFEMFLQLNRITRNSQGGLGIGLTVVRRLTELHGGTIVAQSEGLGKGSTFTVTLPIHGTHPIQGTPANATSTEITVVRKILVTDDNEAAAKTLGMSLELQGHQVRLAHNGKQCLDLAEAFAPDVVLIDLDMPIMDGFTTAQKIRQQSWGKTIRLIALTGWGQESDRKKTHAAGFDHHLVKPADPMVLTALLA